MRTILVDTAELESAAAFMEQSSVDYESSYHRLFEAVERLSVSWQGKDNLAFSNQIQGFQDDFRSIVILIQQYIDFLRGTARAYRDTQNELAAQASKLIN